jgi:hypothetical protein
MRGVRWHYRLAKSGATIGEVSRRVPNHFAREIAGILAASLRESVEVSSSSAKSNPTLVHHGYAQNAAWHLTTEHHAPLADLYFGTIALARKVAQSISNYYQSPVRLFNNEMSYREQSLVKHPGQVSLKPRTRRNPAGHPKKGEVWTTLRGKRCRIQSVSGGRVVYVDQDSGDRVHSDLDEFLATHRAPRTHAPARNRRGLRRNPEGRFVRSLSPVARSLEKKAMQLGYLTLGKGRYLNFVDGDEVIESTPGDSVPFAYYVSVKQVWGNQLGFEPLVPAQYALPENNRRNNPTRRKRTRQHVLSGPGASSKKRGSRRVRSRSRRNPHAGWRSGLIRLNNGQWVLSKANDSRSAAHWIVRSQAEKERQRLWNDGDYEVYKPAGGRMFYLRYVGPQVNPRGRPTTVRDAVADVIDAARFPVVAREVRSGKQDPARSLEFVRRFMRDEHERGIIDAALRLVRRVAKNPRGGECREALSALALEATHYRDSGKGKAFLTAAIARANAVLTGNPRGPRRGFRRARRTRSRMTRARRNPRGSVSQARATYRRLNQNEPGRLTRVKVPAGLKGAAVRLGELVSFVYESDKYAGQKDNPHGKKQLWEHRTKRPRPVLATDASGREVHIVGGQMHPTPDGLVN